MFRLDDQAVVGWKERLWLPSNLSMEVEGAVAQPIFSHVYVQSVISNFACRPGWD